MLMTLLIAGALPHTLIIFSGGATQEAADAELANYEKLRPAFETLLEPLAKGYPKVMDSAKVEGLKPGFFVVVLAACDSALAPNSERGTAPYHSASQLLELFKAIDPRVYSRSVKWSEPLACPDAKDRWTTPHTAEVKLPGGLVLSGSLIDWVEDGPAVTAVFLRGEKGVVVDSAIESGSCSPGSIEKKGAGLLVGQTCVTGRCTSWGHSQFDTTWTVKDGKLAHKVKERVLNKAWCD